ncbi:glycosyltransferase family 4 protein [Candidatus Woesearchaeota archaeon]|nr:glycosyltransferase family 4 protein [Candidatus Woesearchaeota archaeon]
MNILFVLENYIPHIGGVEVLFQGLSEKLVKKGYSVTILTHRLKDTKQEEILNGVKIIRVNCFHSRYLFSLFAIPQAIRLAKEHDIINTTTFTGVLPAWIASKIMKKPNVLSVMEVWIGKWRKLTEAGIVSSFLHNFLEKIIYKFKFDKYAVISKSTAKQLTDIGIDKNKIEVIYPGIDYNHWDPSKYDEVEIRKKFDLDTKFVYFFYGRPGISKGLEYLIRAVPLISKQIKNSILVAIVSKDKTYEKRYDYILDLIKKLGVENKVLLIDPVPYNELPNYIKMADCVVVPSLAEGFGFTTVESCAMNKPVVASKVGSIPEVISGKYVLVKPGNAEAIAKGVEMVYHDKFMRSELKKFELEDNIKGYLKVYEGLIK